MLDVLFFVFKTVYYIIYTYHIHLPTDLMVEISSSVYLAKLRTITSFSSIHQHNIHHLCSWAMASIATC